MGNDMYFENEDQGAPKVVRRRKKQLYASIRERMEFYFSDANLQKDRYLSQLINRDPQVELDVFLKFNRILQLTNNTNDLVKALKKSDILELTEDKTKVFRTTPIKEKVNADECTIYVEQLSCDADHDWLKDVFSKYGKVDYISIPKYKSSGKIKGFAFVEFDTPESAQKALDDFEKAGCCLTNQMNPEQLCSISTYDDDKLDGKIQYPQQINDGNKLRGNNMPENDKRLSRKRKNQEKITQEGEDGVPRDKKLKKSDSNENIDRNESSKETNCDVEVSDVEDKANREEEETAGPRKKKNRKKKKSHKSKYARDIPSYGLHILSKADWKKLRNKYLNIQKEKMKKLKQHLYKSQMSHTQRQQHIIETQSKPRFEFKTGVVVKVTFDGRLEDSNQIAQFKCHAKSLENVEYVDVTQGCTEGYIRFNNENTVQDVMQSKQWDNMTVLEGEEEQEYWEKMKKDRCEKFENKRKFNNRRGRKKLINKAEKLISKRIRLSVDE